jgi:hypothetical protein
VADKTSYAEQKDRRLAAPHATLRPARRLEGKLGSGDAEPSGEAEAKVRPGKREAARQTQPGGQRQKLRKEITSAAVSERETGTGK